MGMMAIGSVTGTNSSIQAGFSNRNMQTDSVSKNIQNQIANAQKALQELSSNEDMTLEEKMKKRQEIQQEIASLNQQLRQHQIEQRKEQQKEQRKDTSTDDVLGGGQKAQKAENNGSRLSQASMQAMISADSSIKQAKVQGSVATRMEGKAGVLEVEIKLDNDRGGSTEKKEEELADVREKAQAAEASQLSTLADANKTMEEAGKADKNADSEEEAAEDENEKTDKTGKADGEDRADKEAEPAASQPTTYTPIDVRL